LPPESGGQTSLGAVAVGVAAPVPSSAVGKPRVSARAPTTATVPNAAAAEARRLRVRALAFAMMS
jgi:hypothetical protein